MDDTTVLKTISCGEEIERFVSTLDTGDILFFTNGRFHSVVSFTIQTMCHSQWTHACMVVKDPQSGQVLIWESVNQHQDTSIFTDFRTGKPATGNGARLINLLTYLQYGYEHLHEFGKKTCIFAVLRLNRVFPGNNGLKKDIENFILRQSLNIKIIYPTTFLPLIKAWYDGWMSCFVCCGLFSTYDVEMTNLTLNSTTVPQSHGHYHTSESGTEEVFCSQLVIMTLEKTRFFKSYISCEEWTVDDLTKGRNINTWLFSTENEFIGYMDNLDIRTMLCKNL